MSKNPKDVYKRLDQLKSDRGTWESHWQDIGDYIIPNKNDIVSINTPGKKRNLNIFDGTAIQSNELLAGALHGILTNPSSYFFELYTGVEEVDRDDAARKWLQRVAKIMHDAMNGSNFQTEIHEVYLDLGSFGTNVMSIDDDDVNILRFMSHHLSKTWIDENNYGVVDTVFRLHEWKPKEIIDFIGEDKAPEWLMKCYNSDPDKKVEFLNVVGPREDYDNQSISPERYRFYSCWYLNGGREPEQVKESGFRTMPYVTPRWTKGTGETYGRSPGMKCLPDVKMINKMMYVIIRGSEKAIDPPLLIPDDSVIGTVKTNPGGFNYFRSGTQDFIRPLDTGSRSGLDMGYQVMEDVRKRIREAYYLPQLQLQEGPQKTATEVMQIREENLRFLGPILGRQHYELLQPMIERIYDIMDRKRLFPPMPEIMLRLRPAIRVQYRSTLAKAQLSTEASNIQRVVGAAAPFIQLDPNARDLIDSDEGVRYVANLYGLPQELIRDKKSIESLRQGRAEAQQAAAQQAQQAAQVEQASQLAPVVKAAAGQ